MNLKSVSLTKGNSIIIIILISFAGNCTKRSETPVSPVVSADTIAGALNETVYAGTTKGSICAFNAADGHIKWITKVFAGSLNLGFNSSPTLVNGVIYIGSPSNKVVALDAASGSIKWTCTIGGYSDFFLCSPLVINDMLYIGHSNSFYGINAANGNIVWSYSKPTGAVANQFDVPSPCFNTGVVYTNCVDNSDEGLYGFDALTGKVVLKYLYRLDYATVVSPCVYNNNVYTAFTDNGSSIILKYNIDNPNQSRSYTILTDGSSSPTVFNSNIYIGSSDYLYSYNDSLSGSHYRWRLQGASNLSGSSPTADSNSVYISSSNGIIYAVNDSTGVERWEYQVQDLGGSFGPTTSPTLANGVIYYGSISGLYALNAKTGKLIWHNDEGGGVYSSPCVLDRNGSTYHGSLNGIKN